MANQFSSYVFAIGSRHPVIKIIKEFLNTQPKVSQFNLPLTDEFNSQVAASVAEYQRHKLLPVCNGVMNFETYSVMGKDIG